MLKSLSLWAILLAVPLAPEARAEDPKKEPPAKKLNFKAPKEWKELGPDKLGIVAARFQTGAKDVAVTVTALEGDGGGVTANVNRWRGQVGLEALNDQAALGSLESLKVDGLTGHVMDVTGPAAADKITQRLVVVLVRRGEQTWYVRMGGPANAVEKQKTAFDEFVKSIHFEK